MLNEHISVKLNHVDDRIIYFQADPLHKDNMTIRHSNQYGIPSSTEYVLNKQQAIKLAESILRHYREEQIRED